LPTNERLEEQSVGTDAPVARADGLFIREWLLCGEFPNPPHEGEETYDHSPPCVGLETDYLAEAGGEAQARPVSGREVRRPDGTKIEWFSYASPADVVDLHATFGTEPKDNVVAYAYTVIDAERAGAAVLSLGSDDGARVWLNGELVHDVLAARGVRPDDDLMPIELREGRNSLLIKVEQGRGNWGFMARIAIDPEAKVFDLGDTRQTVDGFGVHIWGSNHHAAKELEALNIRYVRITKDWTSWEDLQGFRALTDRLGIEWLYVLWSSPGEFRDDGMLSDVSGYARHWRDLVADLDTRGLRPHFIDLMNEPDSGGGWSTGISPDDYNALVKQVRADLDEAGFTDVGIVGPGLTNMDWGHRNSLYFEALDDEAVAALAAFASHAWDDGSICQGGADCVARTWPDFGDSADAKDPRKPKWVTEYATKETTFHGVTYPHADRTGGYATAHTMAYAARVYENTLAHFHQGASAVFYWCAQDGGKSWGYVDKEGNRKPIYYALLSLYPKIPVGARVVAPPEQTLSPVYAGVFVHGDGVVVCIANDSDAEQTSTITLQHPPSRLHVAEAVACVLDRKGDRATETEDTAKLAERDVEITYGVDGSCSFPVALPADSTLTIVLEADPDESPARK
jgi:hypothetical protein